MLKQALGRFQYDILRISEIPVPADTSGFFLHVPQESLSAAEIVVDALAADLQLLSNLAERKILIIP